MYMKLSEYLCTLDIMGARNSREYVGTKVDNPAMILEENLQTWIKLSDLEDLQECFKIFQEKVCVPNFPARYSPQFWLAHAALTTIYNVLSYHLEYGDDIDVKNEINELLYELWCRLISSGPGSTHLEMMDIILKHQHYPLWKHIKNLHGEGLTILISTLKTDFVYKEDVSADHYATLMETHIDKIFKVILSDKQMEEARRGLLDLCLFYLSRMNHVPPHIGPRLSHLCFVICNRYPLENPYMGFDDWVLLRHHLKIIKDVITNPTFTVASEAQYRAPQTLEKIFQAAVSDQMLDIMYKDFMSLLVTICSHDNSKKCQRLFVVYKTGLFDLINIQKGFESTPYWIFNQTIQTLGTLSKTISMVTHIDEFIIDTQHCILEQFKQLKSEHIKNWHELIVNYLVSGRTLLVMEAGKLLNSSILKDNKGLDWKTYTDQCKLFIDIISDMPSEFLQKHEDKTSTRTVHEYSTFIKVLLKQIIELELEGRVRQNVHKCLLQCLEKDHAVKASISYICVQSTVTDLTDINFLRDVLFSVEVILRDPGCPRDDLDLINVIKILLKSCLDHFRSKGYVAVDLNSLFISICLSCLSHDSTSDHVTKSCDTGHVTKSCDISDDVCCNDLWDTLYNEAILAFLELHIDKGTVRSITSLVPQILLVMQDSAQKQGTIPKRCIDFLSVMSSKCFQLIQDHVTKLVELFLDWQTDELLDLLVKIYKQDDHVFIVMFQDLFTKTLLVDHQYRHHGMKLLEVISNTHPQLFVTNHVCLLLGTYSSETKRTQEYLLNIIYNISKYNTSIVSTYFTFLIDDSKFDTASLIPRVPIFRRLCQHSEDIYQRCIDYLMKFINSKDENVSLVAMETIFSLVKDKPTFIQKQKMKFKNLWKSTNSGEVKELCEKLVPELRSTRNVPVTKTTTTKSKSAGIKVESKDTVTNIKKSQVKTFPQVKITQMKSSAVTNSAQHSVDESSTTLTAKGVGLTPNIESSGEPINGAKLTEDNMSALNDRSVSANEQFDIKNSYTGELYKSQETSDHQGNNEPQSVNFDTPKVNDLSEAAGDSVSKTSDGKLLLEFDKVEMTNTDGKLTDTQVVSAHKSDGMTSVEVDIKKESQSNEVVVDTTMECKPEDKVEHSEVEKENFKPIENMKEKEKTGKNEKEFEIKCAVDHVLNTQEEVDLHVYSCGSSNIFANKLKEKLKMAGYESIVKTLPSLDCGEIIGAKVIIMCCDRYQDLVEPSLNKQLQLFEQTTRPVIYLMGKPSQQNGTKHVVTTSGRYKCIRFYRKLGEDTIQDTIWPKHKFCELLMQLNYHGVCRNDKSVTQEFRSVWEKRSDEKEKHLRKSYDDRSFLLPDIFVSYQWGRQQQVEPLYSHLMNEGLLCWMGAYQMDGSESLYNKIQQGLLSCRVVLACVTKKYEQCEICLQDVKTASKLGRAIIPVLMDDSKWPLSGEMGAILKETEPIKLKSVYNVQHGFLPSAMKSLLSKLRHYIVTNRDDHVLEIPSEIRYDTIEEEGNDDDDDDDVVVDQPSDYSNRNNTKFSKSSTLMKFEKNSSREVVARRHSNTTGVVTKTKNNDDDWSEDEYSMRTSRSKSCTIL